MRDRTFTRVGLQMCSTAYLAARRLSVKNIFVSGAFVGGQELAKVLRMLARFMIAEKSDSRRFAP